jgi:hypothetical protein
MPESIIDDMMLIIKTLDPRASLQYSEYTKQWYIEAGISRVEDKDEAGCVLVGITEHCNSPVSAICTYFAALTGNPLEEFATPDREDPDKYTHWRWNGAGFVVTPRHR